MIKKSKKLVFASNILVSEKELHGTNKSNKYFIGYNDDDVIRPLCIKPPQMIGYVKHFERNKTTFLRLVINKTVKKVY